MDCCLSVWVAMSSTTMTSLICSTNSRSTFLATWNTRKEWPNCLIVSSKWSVCCAYPQRSALLINFEQFHKIIIGQFHLHTVFVLGLGAIGSQGILQHCAVIQIGCLNLEHKISNRNILFDMYDAGIVQYWRLIVHIYDGDVDQCSGH